MTRQEALEFAADCLRSGWTAPQSRKDFAHLAMAATALATELSRDEEVSR